MGIEKIRAKYDQVEKQKAMLQVFPKAIKDMQAQTKKVEDSQFKLWKKQAALLDEAKQLDTLGIKAFEDYKRHVIAQVESEASLRKLPTLPIEKLISTETASMIKDFNEWIEHLAGPFPKAIKSGMTFYFNVTKLISTHTTNALMRTLSDPVKDEIDVEFTDLAGRKNRFKTYKLTNITPRNFLFLKM
jgi:hypothetical protein